MYVSCKMAAAYHGHTSCFPDAATLEYGIMEGQPCILGQGVYLSLCNSIRGFLLHQRIPLFTLPVLVVPDTECVITPHSTVSAERPPSKLTSPKRNSKFFLIFTSANARRRAYCYTAPSQTKPLPTCQTVPARRPIMQPKGRELLGCCVAGAHVAATAIVSSKQAEQAAAPGE